MALLVGHSTVGDYTRTGQSFDDENFLSFVAVETGTATSISTYMESIWFADTVTFTLRDSLGNLLAEGTTAIIADSMVTATIPSTGITAGQTYILGMVGNGTYNPYTDDTLWQIKRDTSSQFGALEPTVDIGVGESGAYRFAIWADGVIGPVLTGHPPSAYRGETGLTITADSGLGSPGTATYGGQPVLVDSWTDTQVVLTIPVDIGVQHSSAGEVFQLTSAETNIIYTDAVPFSPETGDLYLDVIHTEAAIGESSSIYYNDTELNLTGSQYVYNALTSEGLSVVITDEGFVHTAGLPAVTQTFEGYLITSNGTVGPSFTYTIQSTAVLDLKSTVIGVSLGTSTGVSYVIPRPVSNKVSS